MKPVIVYVVRTVIELDDSGKDHTIGSCNLLLGVGYIVAYCWFSLHDLLKANRSIFDGKCIAIAVIFIYHDKFYKIATQFTIHSCIVVAT